MSHSLEARKSKLKVLTGQVAGEGTLLGLQMAVFRVSLYTNSTLMFCLSSKCSIFKYYHIRASAYEF